jgi:hypothetical protein
MGYPVLTDDVNIYYIYYGNWTDSAKETLEHFGEFLSRPFVVNQIPELTRFAPIISQ